MFFSKCYGQIALRLAVLIVLILPVAGARAASVTHVVAIGIDSYQSFPPLRGAATDALSIGDAFRRAGVADVTVLTNRDADRMAILHACADLRTRVRPGDTAIFSFAGLGSLEQAQESLPNGHERVFLLSGAGTSLQASSQRILFSEIKHLVAELTAAGATVLFVADTSFGGDQLREIDWRISDGLSFRAVAPLVFAKDGLAPISTPADARLREQDFGHAIFLFATDAAFKAPEIRVGDDGRFRGALSYALAQAIDSAGTESSLKLHDIVERTRQIAYQISDQRQNISVSGRVSRDDDMPLTRSIKQVAGPGMPVTQHPPASGAGASIRQGDPLRIAALDGRADHFAGLAPLENAFLVVQPNQSPELLWDQAANDAIVGGDVIAHNVGRDDIPSIVDRIVAVRNLKQMTAQSPQTIILAPGSSLHHQGAKVAIEIENVGGRSLILFNIAGDGTVQLLYPIGSDPPILEQGEYKLELLVREPYGSDQIVAITGDQRMSDLEQAFNRLKDRRTSGQIQKILARYAPAASRFGSVGVFTAP